MRKETELFKLELKRILNKSVPYCSWMESYDHAGNVIRVHPKSINGQPVSAQHYPPTGAELKSWK